MAANPQQKQQSPPPPQTSTSSPPIPIVTDDEDSDFVDEEISIDDRDEPAIMIDPLYTQPPPVKDDLVTHTSKVQDETVEKCLHFLSGEADAFEYNEHGVPRLAREKHIRFLHGNLGRLPARFVAADAARPWYMYWVLSALTMLGEDISSYKESVAATARSMQNETGGFGGGPGHISHLATTYAVVLAISLIGDEEAYEVIDRRAMWKWLCSLKQPDGGFQVCLGGEEDIRGAYCASVIIALLDLPLDLTPESPAWKPDGSASLFTGLADYVRRCQTFEGGISGQPNAEAHGAYAFCALGCLAILDNPARIIPKYLNIPQLVSWLSSRQYAPEAGFSGRTNKLVDGCYSHWVGGCFPLIEAALSSNRSSLPAADQSLFSREGLIRYILNCCQDETRRGGLRDKPGKPADAYHTCYVLSGLSSAQHQWLLDEEEEGSESKAATAADWVVLPYLDGGEQIFDAHDRVRPIHPVYAIPQQHVRAAKKYFGDKGGF